VTDLAALDATAQAALVRSGDATPGELVDAAIARIEKLDPELNAVVHERFDRAREEVRRWEPAGPLAGVPFLLKDLACPMAGEPMSDGMRAAKDARFTPASDSFLVRRFRAAGLVVLGRTNSPELGLLPTTEPRAFGPTRNPWNPARTPGGSSGGAAAAVAAGLVPAAHASDGGGSIRIPASCCGLVGLKTSRGRVSLGPAAGELSRFLSVQFAVTRSVRDAALLLDIAAGEEPGDPVVAPVAAGSYSELARVAPAPLRIGLMTEPPGRATTVHADCVRAAEDVAHALEQLGHDVDIAHPDALDAEARLQHFGVIWAVNAAFALRSWSTLLARDITHDDVEPLTWALAERGREVSAPELLEAVQGMQAWSRDVARWWHEGHDLLLTPTVGEPPPELGSFFDPENVWHGFVRAGTFTPFTPFANQTGQPAISLPGRLADDGMPIGVQLVAAYGREDLLLQVATQLEGARPWAHLRPRLHATN